MSGGMSGREQASTPGDRIGRMLAAAVAFTVDGERRGSPDAAVGLAAKFRLEAAIAGAAPSCPEAVAVRAALLDHAEALEDWARVHRAGAR